MKTSITDRAVSFEVAQGDGVARWRCRDPLQAAKHLPTWKACGQPDGDASAIRDCANEYAKGGSRRATFSWRYENGEAVLVSAPEQTTATIEPAPSDVPLTIAARAWQVIA